MNDYKIGIFRDKEDLIFNISDKNIINITGITGSGKSTLGKELSINNGYELLNFDWIFGYGYDKDKISNKIKGIINTLYIKYPEIKEKDFFRWKNNKEENLRIKERYTKYATKFYNYIIENIEGNIIIEGMQFLDYINTNDLKGKLVIRRTSLFNCYIRAFRRDVSECYKKYKEKKIKLKDLIDKVIERIKFPISSYKKINKYIKETIDKEK